MLISVNNLQEGRTYEIDELLTITPSLSEIVDATIKDKIHLTGKYIWINEELIIKLCTRYSIDAHCDLCGEITNADCNSTIEEVLTPLSKEYNKREDAFDIGSIIKECIILAIAREVRCSKDCKGICAICGKNLNKDTCVCEEKTEDSNPFGILKYLINTGGAEDGITKKKNI